MANTRVEIISGQLAGSVLENAASETTLRELVDSINRLNRTSARAGGGGGGGIGSLAGNINPVAKSFDAVGNSLTKFSKGAVGAMVGLTASLMKGSEKLSTYTKVLNDELIANIPLVGGAFSTLGGIVNTSITVFESWNDSLKSATKIGASFNNNILEIRNSAAQAYLGLDDFVAILRENREGLAGLGGTVSQGSKAFASVAAQMMRPGGFGRELVNMGYTVEDVQGGLGQFLTTTMKGTKFNQANTGRLADLSGKYLMTLDKLTKLTGKNSDALQNEMQVASQDSMFRLEMMKLGTDERAKMEAGLAEFTSRFGPAGAELFKQVALGMPPLTTNTQMLTATMPGAVDAVIKLQNSAKNTSIGMDRFSQESTETMADAVMSAVRGYGSIENLLKAAASGQGGVAADIYAAYGPVLKQIALLGGGTELTKEKIIELGNQAKKEQKAREGITQALNTFSTATRGIRTALESVFVRAIESVSTAFGGSDGKGGLVVGIENFAAKVETFINDVIGPMATKLGPKVKEFLDLLSSEEGRKTLSNNIKRFFDHAILELRYAIGKNSWFNRQFLGGVGEEEYQREKGILNAGGTSTPQSRGAGPGGAPLRADGSIIQPGDADYPKKIGSTQSLLNFIGNLESKGNYNAVFGGVNNKLSSMTVKEVLALQEQMRSSRRESSAVGKYQIMYDTLNDLIKGGHVGKDDVFNAATQDRLAMALLERRGLSSFTSGKLSTDQFADSLAQEWAALPMASGKSYYAGVGSNKALTDRSTFVSALVGDSQYSRGTLGRTGNYFRDFGNGTLAALHGKEAVLTPDQLSETVARSADATAKGLVGAGAQNGLGEMMNSLNNNMSTLISLTKQTLDINKSQLNVQKRLNPDLFQTG